MKRPTNRTRGRESAEQGSGAGRTWYTIANAAGEGGQPAQLYLYDEIGYWGVTASDFAGELRGITASHLDVRVNSPGGDVFDGIAIYNALKRHSAEVTMYVDALAASAASFIMQAGDRIVIDQHAQVMIHDAVGMMFGNAANARELADQLDRASGTIANIYAERSGVDAQFWRSEMQREVWYDATEAVAVGLADEIDAPRARVRNRAPAGVPVNATWDLSVYTYAGRKAAPAPVIPSAFLRSRAQSDPLTDLLTLVDREFNTASTVDADPLAALKGA